MKKIILLLSVVALAFNSCTTSEDSSTPEPIDETGNVLLKKTITTKGSVVTTDVYSYNDKKINKIVSTDGTNNGETRFTYTGDLITKIEVLSNDVLKSKKEYTYQNDKITEIITHEYNGAQTTKKKAVYVHDIINVDEKVANYEIFSINMTNNQETLITDGTIYFSGRTVMSQLNTDYPVIAGRYDDSYSEYTHNFKKNPTLNIVGYAKLFDNVNATSWGNIGNKKLTTDVNVDGVWTTKTMNYKRTYTYNADLFPNQRKSYNKDEELDNTTQYFYE